MSIADGIFQPGPGDLKYELRSNAKLEVNILIEDRDFMHANVLIYNSLVVQCGVWVPEEQHQELPLLEAISQMEAAPSEKS